MISIGENEEHVGKERKVVSLEETVRSIGSSRNDVINQFDADTIMSASPCKLELETGQEKVNVRQTEISDISHCVLRSPNYRVHDELELRCRDCEESVEAVDVDDSKKSEECNSMSAKVGE